MDDQLVTNVVRAWNENNPHSPIQFVVSCTGDMFPLGHNHTPVGEKVVMAYNTDVKVNLAVVKKRKAAMKLK